MKPDEASPEAQLPRKTVSERPLETTVVEPQKPVQEEQAKSTDNSNLEKANAVPRVR